MKRQFVTITAALLLSSPVFAQTSNNPVQHLENRWAAALKRGDVPSLTAMYEEDAWLVLPGAPPAKGRAAIADVLRVLTHSVTDMKLQLTSIVPLGPNTLIENGVASLQLGKGQRIQMSNYQVVWRRTREGGWKILRDVVSPR